MCDFRLFRAAFERDIEIREFGKFPTRLQPPLAYSRCERVRTGNSSNLCSRVFIDKFSGFNVPNPKHMSAQQLTRERRIAKRLDRGRRAERLDPTAARRSVTTSETVRPPTVALCRHGRRWTAGAADCCVASGTVNAVACVYRPR